MFLCQPYANYLPWTPGTPTWQSLLGQVQEGGGENPEVCLRHLSCRVHLDFLSIFPSKGVGTEMKIPRPLAGSAESTTLQEWNPAVCWLHWPPRWWGRRSLQTTSQFHQAERFPPQLSYSMPLCNISGKYTETVDFTLQRKFWKLFWQTSQNAHTVFNIYSVFLFLAFMRMRSLSNKANDFSL